MIWGIIIGVNLIVFAFMVLVSFSPHPWSVLFFPVMREYLETEKQWREREISVAEWAFAIIFAPAVITYFLATVITLMILYFIFRNRSQK